MEKVWTAWHDLDDKPCAWGTEAEVKAAAKPGTDDADYVESPNDT